MVSKTFVLKAAHAKTTIWPRLSYLCRVRSIAESVHADLLGESFMPSRERVCRPKTAPPQNYHRALDINLL